MEPEFNKLNPENVKQASVTTLVKQIEYCNYETEAGSVAMNLAFIELTRRAKIQEDLLSACNQALNEMDYVMLGWSQFRNCTFSVAADKLRKAVAKAEGRRYDAES